MELSERIARMQISGLGRPSYVSYGSAAPAAPTTRRFSFASVDGQAWIRVADDADALRTSVIDLRRMLSKIDPRRYVGGASETRTEIGTASAEGTTLDIDLFGTYATRRSKEMVNTDPPPFGPVAGGWQDGTTAAATVSGSYTGGTAETYTFVVDRIQVNSTRIEILDSAGDRVRLFNVDNDRYGQPFDVDEGLVVTFDPGTFVLGDSFTVSAQPEPPLPIDPDVAFDQPGNLEAGMAVTDGSFEVNGTLITVSSTDTLNDVLARITSLSDVQATFDVANQHVVLSNKSVGDLAVDLKSDTSGFLEAFKLRGAALERGGDADPDEQMKSVDALASVSDGTITINGTGIAISRNQSLNEVLTAINASGGGVQAAIVDGRVTITNLAEGGELALDGGGTGFFAAVGLVEGTVEAPTTTVTTGSRRRPAGTTGATARELTQAVMDIGERLSSIMNADVEGTVLRTAIGRIGSESRRISVQAFGVEGSPQRFRMSGLEFDLRTDATELFDTSTRSRHALSKALALDIRDFHAGMMDEMGNSGKSFLDGLEAMADQLFTQARGSIDLRI